MINDFIGSIARSELYTQNLHFDLYKDKSYTPVAIKTNLAMKKKIFNLSSKTWFDRYKIKKGIKEFKKYFLTTIPPFEETGTLIGNKIEKTRVENLNKLAELRKRLAKKIDKVFGTNIRKVKLPPIMEQTEIKINNLLEKIKNKKANGK